MRIVVDAFGSDDCPGPDVEGAVLAARAWGDEIILVGPEEAIRTELSKHDTTGLAIRVVHAPDVLSMTDHSESVRNKPDSSIRVGLRLVKEGQADAFVSAGNTIACLSGAIFELRRIRGIRRPALCSVYPAALKPYIFLDMGATADVKPEYLLQFAEMGAIYAEKALGIAHPRVGLLANGEEEEKGSMSLRDTFALFRQSDLNFVGNVEPKDAAKGHCDVLVTDGFTGNIMLKTTEAVASFIARLLKQHLWDKPISKVGLLFMTPGLLLTLPGLMFLLPQLRAIFKRLDYAEHGGGLLLGVNGVVIVGHGRSNAKAIKNAVRQAREAVAGDIVPTILAGLKSKQQGEKQ